MSNFLKFIQEESFYNDLLKKAKRICLSKHLVGQWDLDVYEAGDLVALVYERMIESYKKNSVKYNNLNKSELFSWFMTTLRGISIDQVRKLYSKKITTDKVYKSEKKNDIFKDEVKAETKKRVEWMELDNEFKTGIKNKKIPILGTNIQEDIYEISSLLFVFPDPCVRYCFSYRQRAAAAQRAHALPTAAPLLSDATTAPLLLLLSSILAVRSQA